MKIYIKKMSVKKTRQKQKCLVLETRKGRFKFFLW